MMCPLLSFSQHINWREVSHLIQVTMILHQFFVTSSAVYTTIINFHLIAFVRIGKKALNINKYFHSSAVIISIVSTIPCVLGIISNIHFPFFEPAQELEIISIGISGPPIITINSGTEEFLNNLVMSTSALIWGSLIFSSILWVMNIVSYILAKTAVHHYNKRYLLFDEAFQREFGIDISLRTVSILLIIAQIPGMLVGCWLFFNTDTKWLTNPIILQCCFGFGASIQGLLNGGYYALKREVRNRYCYLLKCCTKGYVPLN